MPSRRKPYTGTWHLRPDFIKACDWTPRPDGRTEYLVARKGEGEDVTSFHPGQWDWSIHNMPEVIYQLNKDASWDKFRSSERPPQKIDRRTGTPMFEKWPKAGEIPRPMLNFKILPDQIGTEEQSWYIEAIQRLDPRVSYDDIVMRMMNVNSRLICDEKQFRNLYLNNPLSRPFRPKFNLISWHGRPSEAGYRILEKLSPAQIAANTTRGTTPGLVDHKNPNGPRVPVPLTPRNVGRRPGRRIKKTKDTSPPSELPPSTDDLEYEASSVESPTAEKPSFITNEREELNLTPKGIPAWPATPQIVVARRGTSHNVRSRRAAVDLQSENSPPPTLSRRMVQNIAPRPDRYETNPPPSPFSVLPSFPQQSSFVDHGTRASRPGARPRSRYFTVPEQNPFKNPAFQGHRSYENNNYEVSAVDRQPKAFHQESTHQWSYGGEAGRGYPYNSYQHNESWSNTEAAFQPRFELSELGQPSIPWGLSMKNTLLGSDNNFSTFQLGSVFAMDPALGSMAPPSQFSIIAPSQQPMEATAAINWGESQHHASFSQSWPVRNDDASFSVVRNPAFPSYGTSMSFGASPFSSLQNHPVVTSSAETQASTATGIQPFSKEFLGHHQIGGIGQNDRSSSQLLAANKQRHRTKRASTEAADTKQNQDVQNFGSSVRAKHPRTGESTQPKPFVSERPAPYPRGLPSNSYRLDWL